MTDAQEIANAINNVANALLAVAKAQRSIAYELAKCNVSFEQLNEKIKVEEIEEE